MTKYCFSTVSLNEKNIHFVKHKWKELVDRKQEVVNSTDAFHQNSNTGKITNKYGKMGLISAHLLPEPV